MISTICFPFRSVNHYFDQGRIKAPNVSPEKVIKVKASWKKSCIRLWRQMSEAGNLRIDELNTVWETISLYIATCFFEIENQRILNEIFYMNIIHIVELETAG